MNASFMFEKMESDMKRSTVFVCMHDISVSGH